MGTAVALTLQSVASLIRWLGYRKTHRQPLNERQKRQLGHLAACMQHFIHAATDLGVVSKLDEDVMFDS